MIKALALILALENTRVMHAQFIESLVIGIIMAAVSIALQELLKPKPKIENARPAADGDFSFPTSIEDRVIPIIFGTVRLAGPNVMWWGDRAQRPIKETIKINMWSQKRVIVGYEYDVGIQFGLCRGPLDGTGEGVGRVWVGEEEVYNGTEISDGVITVDDRNLFGGEDFGNGGVAGTLRIHPGTETQPVNDYLTAHQSPQPAYRGTAYAVLERGYVGNTPSAIAPWSFEVSRYPNTLGLTSGRQIVNGADANLAAVAYELLTNDDWGFGYSPSEVDLSNFRTAGNTLFTEGNGFSFQLESEVPANEFLHELERQMGGVIYLDQQTGQYRINLVRGGYDIATVPKIDKTNTVAIESFSRGSWDETTNQLRVRFSDRSRLYKKTFAKADDLGNVRIQGGEVVSDSITYPGVKDKTLANALASRDIKEKSIPLAKANLTVDRTMWELVLGDVVAWSAPTLDLVDVPMRVIRINRGSLLDSGMQLTLIQDVFEWDVAFFGDPEDTLWVPPTEDVTAINTAEAKILEAPYAIIRRDPLSPTQLDRIWAFARSPGGPEITFKIFQRNDPVTPSGAFSGAGEVFGFMKIGELGTALSPGDAMPTVTIRLDVTPDVIADLLVGFVTATSPDVGNLTNLIMIGDEFLGGLVVVDQTTFVDLKNVYRGMMDTVPATHAIDADVFLVFQGAGLSDSQMPRGNVIDVQLRSRSRTDESTEGESTTVQFTMQDRARSPYPPTELLLNATRYDPTVDFDDLKSGGSNLDERGIEATFTRRDWETENEVEGIETDAGTLDPNFPTKHNTQYKLSVFERAPSLLTSLEGAWNLDEASGNAIDAHTKGLDLTDNATVDAAAGPSSVITDARDFQVVANEFFSLTDPADLTFLDEDFFIDVWVFSTLAGTQGIVSRWDALGQDDREYALWISGNVFHFAVSDDGTSGGATQLNHSLSLSASTWYHVQVWHDATANTINMKVNGAAVESLAHTTGLSDRAVDFRVGRFDTASAEQYMGGRIAALKIWRRVLTGREQFVLNNVSLGQILPFVSTLLGTSGFNSGAADGFVSRTVILRTTDGVLPTDLTSEVETQHDRISETFPALQKLAFDHTRAAGTLDDDTNFGVQDTNVIGDIASAPVTGTYTITLGINIPNGVVEVQVNGTGGFNTVVSTGMNSGTFTANSGEQIEIRHTESVATFETFMEVAPPSGTVGAYGILIN